jgi:HSP20 family protein
MAERRAEMDIVRWDPIKDLEQMSERLTRFMGRPFLRPGEKEALVIADWNPLVDIEETDKEYLVKAELPEVPKADVKVEIREGVLYIEGERKKEKEEKGRKFHRIERSYGKFTRSFSIPDDVDEAKVAAEFKDGILYVKLPRTHMAKAKAFEVKVA